MVWESTGARGRALYFSRARAPHGEGPLFHHVGIYAFRRAALSRFVGLPPSPLEQREKLEQLRALEAGMRSRSRAWTACRSASILPKISKRRVW